MKNEDKRNYMIGWLFVCTVAGLLWLALLLLKALGAITWSWPVAILSVLWLPLLVGLVFFGLVALSVEISDTKARRERRKRQKAVDRRIIAQAKAIGAWDKRPTPLGGRALELKAKEYGIQRSPEEKDWSLRSRIEMKRTMDEAVEKKIAEILEEENRLPKICEKCAKTWCKKSKKRWGKKVTTCLAKEILKQREGQDNGLQNRGRA